MSFTRGLFKLSNNMPIDMKIYAYLRSLYLLGYRIVFLRRIQTKHEKIFINFGCGNNKQEGYINVDIRYTPAVDLLADLRWCSVHMRGKCDEVYLSHVLEHYSYPGKFLRRGEETVLGALLNVNKMLVSRGIIRLAVPDFRALSQLYISRNKALFHKISGRLCGEQNYPENLHRCVFDKTFLTFCLEETGFSNIREWDPNKLGLKHDSSFDTIDGVKTSLNLLAQKI